ncbi:hypothetical protein BGX21_009345 [Mortierella sp. AD011]|nr:hypothetical protein BGX20_009224 [Mortierella sp. AD010]KAF9397028.1 hypothetical protein BGX21_009345 [Mortierella sp. AD011]
MEATGERYFQAFRSRSTSEVFHVQTKPDKTTGQRVILWKDILLPCPDAKYVVNGTKIVTFMTGDDFKDLIPLRIEYQPNATLEIVLRGMENTGDNTDNAPRDFTSKLNITSPPETESSNNPLQTWKDRSRIDTFQERQQHHTNLSKSHTPSSSVGLIGRSAATAQESQAPLESYPLVMDDQANQTTGIMTVMDQHFNNLKVEMQRIKILKTQLVQMQKNIRQAQHQVEEKQQEMTQTQKHLLGPLAAVENRTQSLLSKTYELHENSLPRLFIILPYPEKRQDTFGKLTSDQFRLFFLCECRKHTTTEGGDIPNEIHLSNHEGYHISKPTEFFEKFGSYILTVMQMFKYGITTASVVVQPLEKFSIIDGAEEIQKYIDLTEDTIGTMVDESISFLGQHQKRTVCSTGTTSSIGFDELEDLEYPDLSCLKSYLRIRERGCSLGNLYRVIRAESHVEWICATHYRTIYREDVIHDLNRIVEVNRGYFLENLGSVCIIATSRTLAGQLYDAMVKAQCVQELIISMTWQMTVDDLMIFTEAVTRANVKRLEIMGSPIQETAMSAHDRNLRHNLFIRLACRGKIQSLYLGGIDDFSKRVSSSSWTISHRLRVFKYSPKITPEDRATKSFISGILDHFPGLAELQLKTSQVESLVELVADKLGPSQFSVVTHLEATCLHNSIATILGFSFKKKQILQAGAVPTSDDNALAGRPRVNRGISHKDLKLVISFCEPEHFTKDLFSLHSKYDWPLGDLDVVATDLALYPMARFFDFLTEIKAPRRLSLTIKDTSFVSMMDLQYLERVVSRAQAIEKLSLSFKNLEIKAEQEKLKYLHGPIGRRLTKLVFEGDIPGPCIPALLTKDLLPMLKSFKAINMNPPDTTSKDWIQYIVAMASRSLKSPDMPHSRALLPNVSSILSSESTTSTCSLREGTPLKKFKISSNQLQSKEWRTLIKALDFMMLESISFQKSNFSLKQLKVLIDYVPGDAEKLFAVSLQSLDLTWTDIKEEDYSAQEQFARLKKKIPRIEIMYGNFEDPIYWS